MNSLGMQSTLGLSAAVVPIGRGIMIDAKAASEVRVLPSISEQPLNISQQVQHLKDNGQIIHEHETTKGIKGLLRKIGFQH